MKKHLKAHPRFWISLAFSLVITMLTCIEARDEAESSVFWWSVPKTQRDIKRIDNVVRAYRQKNGALPKSLEQLNQGVVPTQQVDLNDAWGRPFIYKVEGKNYRITSYGRDLQPGGTGQDCDLSNDNLNPPEAHLSYYEFLTNPITAGMAFTCVVCGILAFFIGWATIGTISTTSIGYVTLVVKLVFTLVATLFITMLLVAFHVPSGH